MELIGTKVEGLAFSCGDCGSGAHTLTLRSCASLATLVSLSLVFQLFPVQYPYQEWITWKVCIMDMGVSQGCVYMQSRLYLDKQDVSGLSRL